MNGWREMGKMEKGIVHTAFEMEQIKKPIQEEGGGGGENMMKS